MEQALRRHLTILTVLTVALAAAHIALAGLYLIDRAAPAIVPVGMPDWLEVFILSGDDHFWIVLHATAALALIAALVVGVLRALAAFLSQTVWAAWCVVIFLWSLWTSPPVSLAAPVLLAILTVPLGRVVASTWTDEEMHCRRKG
ncbi:hypothetical protein CGZ93_17955 [Enemella dayhoffiae]|uniref:Uncharacterized protein n=1 Tax=Enemella dayhoffiae TaxID=2016507 RepID=A0A255GLE0_9ACTN|nr:hypothetical protein [Enemella dayhoffiae]OYO16645.1 hypothetical protein CGZ93_17955 [Enemella dayhoffiae]